VAVLDFAHLLRRALGDDGAAAFAAFGAHVDEPVGALDDVQIVLDHEDRVAQVGQAIEHIQKVLDVGEVQAGRGLIEDVERVAGGVFAELRGQLDALGFAAGELGAGLADLDVGEADVVEGL
jgi:hypothetical protein